MAEDQQDNQSEPGANFALTPAQVNNDYIDYGTKAGENLWKQATLKLAEEPFDCTADGLRDFLQQVQRRAEIMGWDNSVLTIPRDIDNPVGPSDDFFEHYGELKMETLRECASSYVLTQTRVAQDSVQLYHCLYNSLSKAGRDKVSLRHAEYTVNSIRSGLLLLKVIIQASTIDTNATTSAIRMALASLDEYMPSVGDDITKFNQYVAAQVELLKARGRETHDLTVNLFKAYATVKDSKFREYIALKESEYEENNEDLPAEKLMELAENKFKIRKLRQQWNAPTAEEQKIIALEAYIKKMEKKGPKKPALISATKSEKKGTGSKASKRTYEPEPWMLQPPNEGEPKEKTVKNKTWYWCPKHNKWTRHKPSECKGINPKQQQANKAKDKKIKFARAITALAEESEEE